MDKQITIVGLGAGDVDQLPLGVFKILTSSLPLFVRTEDHPVLSEIKDEIGSFQSFDSVYEMFDQFEDVYAEIAKKLLEEAEKYQHIVYAVPGHPLVAEKTVQLLLKEMEQGKVNVSIQGGQSFLDAMFQALRIDPVEGLQFIDAQDMKREELSFRQHLIICQVYDKMIASDVKLTLMEDLPFDYEVYLVTAAGSKYEDIKKVRLYEMDRCVELSNLTSLYIPPVKDEQLLYHRFSALRNVIRTLRGPNGCPWDRKQTHQSLKRYLIEECYELIEAIDENDIDHMIEELGDVLLQVVLHAQIGDDEGFFTIDDVIRMLTDKMIRRHPHVFGNVEAQNAEEAVKSWEEAKKSENRNESESLLDSVSKALPALSKAYQYQRKAAKVGFDWPDVLDAWEKVSEELQEFKKEIDNGDGGTEKAKEEFGDILFALINVGRFYEIEPEEALVMTNEKFSRRFRFIEQKTRDAGKNLKSMSLAEMDQYWEEAKMKEGDRT